MNVNPVRYYRHEEAGEVDVAAIRQLLADYAEPEHSLTDTIFLSLITNIAFLYSVDRNDLNIDLAPTQTPLPHDT